jgi:hypothetical protein
MTYSSVEEGPELPLLEWMWRCHVLFVKQFASDGPHALIFVIQFSHGLAAMNHPNVFCLWHNCLEATVIGNCWDGLVIIRLSCKKWCSVSK